jgi:hypothetical protein
VSVEKFLKQRAVNIAVSGNYTPAKWFDPQGKPRTFACRTTRISPFRMIVDVPVVGKLGDPISSYFADFGKLQGFISDTMPGAFLLDLEMTGSMRENLASNLLAGKEAEATQSPRRQERRAHRPGNAALHDDLGGRQRSRVLHH